ncbi:hypothetical protein AC578_10588 [Pseudocercospora eumusae]|uniref:Peptidase S54 rhomboid domain-containing protein n=1 Tax=Pseudocercospora eumusae TaxID=321146 RepID=A0A139HKI5_9PEZI|nr:hypothetical protein AC578_10588 [Pseudocercospora eumusae]
MPFISQSPLRISQPRLTRPYTLYSPPPPSSYNSISLLLWTIIGLNTAIFGTWLYADTNPSNTSLKSHLYKHFTLKDSDLREGNYHTLITSAFSHKEPTHFLFNMMGLACFMNAIRIVPGIRTFRVVALVLGSAVVSSAAFLYHNRTQTQNKTKPRNWIGNWNWNSKQQVRTIRVGLGASGIVMGLAATATCLNPMLPMMLLAIPFPMPLFMITGAFVGLDYYLLNSEKTTIGHAAHLGGFAFGVIFYLSYWRRLGGVWTMLTRWR